MADEEIPSVSSNVQQDKMSLLPRSFAAVLGKTPTPSFSPRDPGQPSADCRRYICLLVVAWFSIIIFFCCCRLYRYSFFFFFLFLVVVRHLEAGALEAALDVEALVGLAAVEDGLVAADALGDVVEGLDEAQAQLLALLVLGDGDVLDVADQAEVVDAVCVCGWRCAAAGLVTRRLLDQEGCVFVCMCVRKGGGGNVQFPLGDQGARAHDAAGAVLDDQDVVAAVLAGEPGEALGEPGLADVADGREDAQAVEEAAVVVGRAQGADAVAGGQGGGHGGADEVVAEQARAVARCLLFFWC